MSHAGTYVRIWLHLLKEGGWHTEAEIVEALSLRDDQQPSVILYQMKRLQYVVSRKGEEGRREFAITGVCKIPAKFLSVNDLTRAMA